MGAVGGEKACRGRGGGEARLKNNNNNKKVISGSLAPSRHPVENREYPLCHSSLQPVCQARPMCLEGDPYLVVLTAPQRRNIRHRLRFLL